jgi:hypothetical protein
MKSIPALSFERALSLAIIGGKIESMPQPVA